MTSGSFNNTSVPSRCIHSAGIIGGVRRRLFTAASALSLLLLAATAAFWYRSYRRLETLCFTDPRRTCWSIWGREGTLHVIADGRWPDRVPLHWIGDSDWATIDSQGPMQPYPVFLDGGAGHGWNWFGLKIDRGVDYLALNSDGTVLWAVQRYRFSPAGMARGRTAVPYLIVEVPFWMLAAIGGVLPAAWLAEVAARRRQRRRLGRAGLCPSCGYDLRASTARCPECGRPITAASAAASCRARSAGIQSTGSHKEDV